MEDEELPLPVKVSCGSYGSEWPPDKLLDHEHAGHAGNESECSSVGSGTDVNIVAVLALGYIHPVLLDWRLVVVHASIKHVLGEVAHAEIDGGLMLSGDASVMLVKLIEVVSGLRVGLCSYNQRHYLVSYLIIINNYKTVIDLIF